MLKNVLIEKCLYYMLRLVICREQSFPQKVDDPKKICQKDSIQEPLQLKASVLTIILLSHV